MSYYKIIIVFISLISINFSYCRNAMGEKDSIERQLKSRINAITISTTGFVSGDSFLENYNLGYSRQITKRVTIGILLGKSLYGEYERTTNIGFESRLCMAQFLRFSYYTSAAYSRGLRTYENSKTLSNWTGTTNSIEAKLIIAYNGCLKKRLRFDFFSGYAFNTLYIESHPALNSYYWSNSELLYGFQINYLF